MNTCTPTQSPAAFLASAFSQTKLPPRFWLRSRLQFSMWPEHLRKQTIRLFDVLMLTIIPAKGRFLYNGKQLRFDARNGQFHAIYQQCYKSGYEFETGLLLLHLCRGSRSFFDVGANWGYFSLLLAATPWFEGQCLAFEPNPPVYLDLTRLIRQAGIEGRVKALNVGVGAKNEELFLQHQHRFLSGLVALNREKGLRIQVVPIDEVAAEPPDIIKIDTEGMEMDVLTGAERTLRERKPHLVFESIINYQNPDVTLKPLLYLQERDYLLFNPTCVFRINGCEITAINGDPFEEMLKLDREPKPVLFQFQPKRRFMLRYFLNVFACHKDRVAELQSHDIQIEDLAGPSQAR